MKKIRANFVDVYKDRIYVAEVGIEGERIAYIEEKEGRGEGYILPGFIDAHIHIESSMVSPLEFSKVALKHGTIGTISDPHEIANIMGSAGIDYMIESAKGSPLKVMFGAPSCVPATSFESSGACIDANMISELLSRPEIGCLSEMMNYPGVINEDKEVLQKLKVARELNLPIDGHAPGLSGEQLKFYAEQGISTDHECSTYEEAEEKISYGMRILIREGSGAKNFQALIPLIEKYPKQIMFCSDDLHPDDLMKGHINVLVRRALNLGYNLFDVIRAAGLNAKRHYKLNTGMLKVGDPADFILIDSLDDMNIKATFINGKAVFEEGVLKVGTGDAAPINKFSIDPIQSTDLSIEALTESINVIRAIDGELITKKEIFPATVVKGKAIANTERDLLKIAVINRYEQSAPALGFITGFGLKRGAIASSIAHDSHNIICIGCTDDEMAASINWIIKHKGGIVVHTGEEILGLPLEIAGIMSVESVESAAKEYELLSGAVKELGSELNAPFMTLAFMALLVIPELKMSDRGLFDGSSFSYASLFV